MASTNFSVRMDSEIKKQCEALYGELGMNLTTAINVFLRQSLRVGGFPFEVRLDQPNKETIAAMLEAERIAKDLKSGPDQADEDYVSEPERKTEDKKSEKRQYSGPSVLSWHLDGRKASHLPIPAYRCYGGGMVTVLITVDNSGRVIDAKIQEETSSDDKCLRDFAIRAARQSRFSIKQDAPARQHGDIIYQFLAQ